MSKDRTLIAKGVPRNRRLVSTKEKDERRILTYATKKKAVGAFIKDGFQNGGDIVWRNENLEAVQVEIVAKELPYVERKDHGNDEIDC